MIRFSIDLELNAQESGETEDIIQLGYSIFDTNSEKILYTGGDYVQISKPLFPFITTLTGITQHEIDTRGVSLLKAYNNMISKLQEYEVGFYQVVEWGSGDMTTLKKQLFEKHPEAEWKLGWATLNLKAVYQAKRIAQNLAHSGGLKTSMRKAGLDWEVFYDQVTLEHKVQRTSHDARCDALNTSRFYIHLLKDFKK